jgi:hypothetical protein
VSATLINLDDEPTMAQLLLSGAATVRTPTTTWQFCTCQRISVNPKDCPLHGHLFAESAA